MDAIDEEIIRCVMRDARSTYAEIGAAAGLSAPAAKRRLDRLVASGAIRGFTALVDTHVLGWGTEAYLEVHCRDVLAPDDLRRRLEAIPEVVEACTVTGPADAMVHLLARDIRHLEQAIQRIRQIPAVDRTESVIVLSRLIDRPYA